MKCPVCSDMDRAMSDRQGIESDYCPRCRGLWLDRGELDKIIERSAATLAPTPPRGRNEEQHYATSGKDPKYYKKKKGGLLGELFDFWGGTRQAVMRDLGDTG